MKKTIASILILTLIICTACAPMSAANGGANAAVEISSPEAKALAAPVRGEKTASIVSGANDFAFRFSAALAKDAGDESFVCSPVSAWFTLAALTNAMDDARGLESAAGLGSPNINASDLNEAASGMLYDLMRKSEEYTGEEAEQYARDYGYEYHNPLAIANAVFVDRNVTLRPDFLQSFADYYRGAAMNVDFASPEAVNAVNRWASENTDGLIPQIVESFGADTAAAIANAAYFSDRWDWEFDPAKTTEDIFHAPGGDTNAFFMHREGDMLTYYEDPKVQAMPLDFKTGGGMMAILPKDGDANGLLASMTNDYFNEIRRDSIRATGKLLLPRFSVDGGVLDLRPALEELGFSNLFDPEKAALSGLIEENIPVWLSGAVQSARIEVDEKGTTAAAVTLIPAPGMAMPQPTEPFEMKCDRPFVFVLYGRGDIVLFTGIVNQPVK